MSLAGTIIVLGISYLVLGGVVIGLLERHERTELTLTQAAVAGACWPLIALFLGLVWPFDAIRQLIRTWGRP